MVMSGSIPDRAVQDIVRACYSAGEDLGDVRVRLLDAIRRVVPFDAAFMAGADPDTLLFTSAFAEEPLAESGFLFLDNEFGAVADVNRFAELARSPTRSRRSTMSLGETERSAPGGGRSWVRSGWATS